jgi:hypothetical protein
MNTFDKRRIPWRPGLSAVEVFVALTLLAAGLSLSAQLVVRHQRLLVQERHYRLALDELSNQLERLSALPPNELPSAIADLRPSEVVTQHLLGAALEGDLRSADMGQRLTLSITWLARDQTAAPLSLSTWLYNREEAAP